MEFEEILIFTLKGKSYNIDFPRVGEYRTIQAMKQTLSLNTYGSMSRSMMKSSEEALDMIDMEAYFSVLCPKLIEDLKCESFSELGLSDYLIIRKVFKDKFVPWWNSVEELLHPNTQKKEVVKNEETE